jgi:hypothetical protein
MSLALSSTARGNADRSSPDGCASDFSGGLGGPVSPELALIDPELARREQPRLHEPGGFRPGVRSPGLRSLHEVPEVVARPTTIAGTGCPTIAAEPIHRPEVQEGPRLVRPLRRPRANAISRRRWGQGVALTTLVAVGVGMSWERQEPPADPVAAPPAPHVGTAAAPRALTVARIAAPARPRAAVDVKTLAWAPARGALAYEVQLFRGSRRVLLMRTREPVLRLRPTWRYEGRVVRRQRGTYLWYVWPVFQGDRRATAAIVQARVKIAPGS